MAEPGDETRALLARHPWGETLPLLVEYARSRIASRTWSGRRGGQLPAGREAEDVVYEAIEKVLNGRRAWDPARKPDLVRFLQDVIESDLNHLAVGFENRRVARETILGERMQEGLPVPFLATIASVGPTPPEQVQGREAEAEAVAFATAFLATLGDEPLLRRIVECVFAGVVGPSEIATRVGATAGEVYNARKRLQRRLTDFYAEWGPRHESNPGRW